MANVAGPLAFESPRPTLYAAECPGSRGMTGTFASSYSGRLGWDIRLAVASHPIRQPDATGGGAGGPLLPTSPRAYWLAEASFRGGIVGSGSGTAAVSNAASGVGAASTTSPLGGGRLASTSCSASDSPPNHAPEPATAASGNVRPPPARCEML